MKLNLKAMTAGLAACAALAVPAAAFADGSVAWSGNVDDTAIVYIHGQNAQTETISGNATRDTRAYFRGHLPHHPVFVSLRRSEGRGRVRIVQQPGPNNGFTAGVRIHDPQPGSSFYRFVLTWD